MKWTRSQINRRERVRAGVTVIANQRKGMDTALIEWAREQGLAVDIDRTSKWGNPHMLNDESQRDKVCDQYITDFELVDDIAELESKVLVCWCSPKRCHGDFLARLANESAVMWWEK